MTRPIADGPPYEPRDYTGDAALDADIDLAFRVMGSLVTHSTLDYDNRARMPAMVLGPIHNLTLAYRGTHHKLDCLLAAVMERDDSAAILARAKELESGG